MPPTRRRIKRRKKSRHLIFILLLIAAAVFLYFEEFEKEKAPRKPVATKPYMKPRAAVPELPPAENLPRVAVIVDDLGISRQKAYEVFNLGSAVTIAILPDRPYSRWIAEEAKRRGHDILLHIPMEATRPMKLGEGGLKLSMNDREIADMLNKDINSVPFIKGVSNHMGSAFTQDERGMGIVIQELKKHRLFFLDSITSAKSIAYKLARSNNLQALQRDVFLDDSDDPVEIEKQWKRLMKIADKKGYAIAQCHPRRNTLDFLQKALKNNNQVIIVPVTDLLGKQ